MDIQLSWIYEVTATSRLKISDSNENQLGLATPRSISMLILVMDGEKILQFLTKL